MADRGRSPRTIFLHNFNVDADTGRRVRAALALGGRGSDVCGSELVLDYYM